MSVDTSVDGVDVVEGVSSVCRECVESVEPGLNDWSLAVRKKRRPMNNNGCLGATGRSLPGLRRTF